MNKTIITSVTAVAFICSYGLRADVPPNSGKDVFPPNKPPLEMEAKKTPKSNKKVAASDVLPGDPNEPGILGDIVVEPYSPRASKDVFATDSEAAITDDSIDPSTELQPGDPEIIGDGQDLPDQESEENELYSTEEKEVSRADDPDENCGIPIYWKNIALAAAAIIVAAVAIVLVSIHEGHNAKK